MIDQINTLAEGWVGALWKASIQGGAALAVVWCICRYVPRISPAFKMWLWRIAWLKLLLTLFWTGSIELPLLSPPSDSAVIGEPVSITTISREVAPQTSMVIKPSLNTDGVLFTLWLLGVIFCLGRLVYQWNRCRQLKRSASPFNDAALADMRAQLRVKRPPELRESTEINMPVLVGIFRPTIIIPSALVNDQGLPMMLAHELAHLKRRDLMWAWLPAICHALFFFHPILWLTRREWLLAQEMACDELALRRSTAAPAAYGNMLVEVVAGRVQPLRFGALGICETAQNLKRRIMAMKTIGRPGSRWLMFALLIAILVAMLPWRIVAQDKPDDPAQRIQQLEQENARLRQELEKVKAGSNPQQLAAEIDATQAELEALRTKYTDEHPRMQEARKRLQKLQEYQAVLKEGPPHRSKEVLQASEDARRTAAEGALRAAERTRLAEVAAQKQRERERELYDEELALARGYADTVRKQVEAGRATSEDLVRAQRQMFSIQREIARLEQNQARLREVLQEEMSAVQRLLNEVKRQVEVGRVPPGHDLDLQREMLKLRRELLRLEEQ